MGLAADLALFEARLDRAVADTMENEVTDAVRSEMSRKLGEYDFPWSRGVHGGGLLDQRNFEAKVEQHGDTTILRVTDAAPFQSGRSGGKTLAEVVETGDAAYHMPGPRPFLAPTQEIMDSGVAEAAFAAGMEARGYGGVLGWFHVG